MLARLIKGHLRSGSLACTHLDGGIRPGPGVAAAATAHEVVLFLRGMVGSQESEDN